MAGTRLAGLADLFGELGDLKRVRRAGETRSVAAGLFRRAWVALTAGEDPREVALGAAAEAVASARLGAIDAGVLARCGLAGDRGLAVLGRSFDAVAGPVARPLAGELRRRLGYEWATGRAPVFVDALEDQPRAGPTHPGRPRIVLEPPETHAEHCLMVAVYAVLLAPVYGAEPADGFVLGLAHHFHNVVLPDSGFAGEELLGDELGPIMDRLNAEALALLPSSLGGYVAEVLPLLKGAEHPASRAFHAADVIDRVIQVRQYARVATFTVDQALDDLELVHAGPVQAFHFRVLEEAGLP